MPNPISTSLLVKMPHQLSPSPLVKMTNPLSTSPQVYIPKFQTILMFFNEKNITRSTG